jgi:serine/threonine protein kinase
MESDFTTKLLNALKEINAQVINESDITTGEKIGQGGFGTVYKGFYKDIPVAIKELIMITKENSSINNGKDLIDDITEIVNEIKVMLVANNDKFPTFHGIVIEDKIKLIFELINGQTLMAIHKSGVLDRRSKLHIIHQLCEIIETLAEKKIIHRDIKPHNIIIEESNRLRLIDFGIARVSTKTLHPTSNRKMTVSYMPPEAMSPQSKDKKDTKPFVISPKLDVWSCGCLLSELFSGIEPWSNKWKNSIGISRALIKQEKFPIPDNIEDEEIKDIINKACENDITKRLTAKEMKELVGRLLEKC